MAVETHASEEEGGIPEAASGEAETRVRDEGAGRGPGRPPGTPAAMGEAHSFPPSPLPFLHPEANLGSLEPIQEA